MSAALVCPFAEVVQLAQLLGIDTKFCTGFDVRVRVGEVVTVTVYGHAEFDQGLAPAQQMFTLHPWEPKS